MILWCSLDEKARICPNRLLHGVKDAQGKDKSTNAEELKKATHFGAQERRISSTQRSKGENEKGGQKRLSVSHQRLGRRRG